MTNFHFIMPTTKSHHLGSVGLAGLEQDWSRELIEIIVIDYLYHHQSYHHLIILGDSTPKNAASA